MIVLSLWLWLWLVWVTVVHGPPAAVDWAPKQQKNEENMFRLLGFLEIEPGTEIEEQKVSELRKRVARRDKLNIQRHT